jgi:hypothetical protein
MKIQIFGSAAMLAALIGLSGSAFAQTDQTLPIPGGEVAKDLLADFRVCGQAVLARKSIPRPSCRRSNSICGP